MATPLEQLDLMRGLQENWDGYNGAPPVHEVIDLGKEFVALIAALRKYEDRFEGIFVTPGRNGGILIEWDDLRHEHSVEINSDGSIGFLHIDKATQRMTEEVFQPGKFAVPIGFVAAFNEPESIAA